MSENTILETKTRKTIGWIHVKRHGAALVQPNLN